MILIEITSFNITLFCSFASEKIKKSLQKTGFLVQAPGNRITMYSSAGMSEAFFKTCSTSA